MREEHPTSTRSSPKSAADCNPLAGAPNQLAGCSFRALGQRSHALALRPRLYPVAAAACERCERDVQCLHPPHPAAVGTTFPQRLRLHPDMPPQPNRATANGMGGPSFGVQRFKALTCSNRFHQHGCLTTRVHVQFSYANILS